MPDDASYSRWDRYCLARGWPTRTHGQWRADFIGWIIDKGHSLTWGELVVADSKEFEEWLDKLVLMALLAGEIHGNAGTSGR